MGFHENRALKLLASADRVVLLQGPIGPFFSALAGALRDAGKLVRRVHFNGGDLRFGLSGTGELFAGSVEQWAGHFEALLDDFRPEAIVLFGQDRPYHAAAIRLARQRRVRCLVFEEGYVRPHYVTFEPDGVNCKSTLNCDPAALPTDRATAEAVPFSVRFRRVGWLAAQYMLVAALLLPFLPRYRHHRSLNIVMEALHWCRAGVRKLLGRVRDRQVLDDLERRFGDHYFFVPLQVYCDAQMTRHSPFESVDAFIRTVIESFAAHAPADAALLFKQHPLDVGHRHYGDLIRRAGAELGVADRLYYVTEAHLPTVLASARGTVVVNSTVGFSSLFHRAPVKVMGAALFDRPGLTYAGPLERFWREPGEVDTTLFERFRAHLIRSTQLPGSFYSSNRDFDGLLSAMRAVLGVAPAAAPEAPALDYERGATESVGEAG